MMDVRAVSISVLASTAAALSFSPLKACAAELDIPIVVKWEQGVPYDLDGPVEVYKDSVWVRDKSGTEDRYVLIDQDYQILEEREELERSDGRSREGGSRGWFKGAEGETAGSLSVSARVPEELWGKDVVVTVSGGDGRTGSLYLREVNGYEQTELVPAGIYRIFEAKILGDLSQKYTPVYEEKDLEISSNGYGHVQIEFKEGIGTSPAETAMQDKKQGTIDKGRMSFIGVILVGIMVVMLVLAIAFVIAGIRHEKE